MSDFYDLRIWAWDLSRPLGEFPQLLNPMEGLFNRGWHTAQLPMMHRLPVGPFAPEELEQMHAGAVVQTITLVKARRPGDGVLCARFATATDQHNFGSMLFS